MRVIIPDQVKIAYRYPARAAGAAGAVLMLVSIFLPWAYGSNALDDMSYYGSPSALQFCFGGLALMVLALLTIPLVGKQCDEANAYWSPDNKSVTICYEDAANALDIYAKAGDADPTASAINSEIATFYHETGHMVIDFSPGLQKAFAVSHCLPIRGMSYGSFMVSVMPSARSSRRWSFFMMSRPVTAAGEVASW